MLKIFGGMIIGSLMTMILFGGVSAADKVLANAQALYFEQIQRPDATTTLLLLVFLRIFLASDSMACQACFGHKEVCQTIAPALLKIRILQSQNKKAVGRETIG